jgi:hypothetical protein
VSSIMGSRGWKRTGALDLDTGRWEGDEFALDADFVCSTTAFIATNDVPGIIIREVHEATGDARLIVVVGEPGAD